MGHTEEVQSSSSAASYPSSLVMVKTTSGKNVILKVVPQQSSDVRFFIFPILFSVNFTIIIVSQDFPVEDDEDGA